MADIVQYDPADPAVAGKVTTHLLSKHTKDYDTLPNTLINPDVTALFVGATRTYTVPLKYWKHSAGSVVEMSAPEKAALDASSLVVIDENFAPHLLVQAELAITEPGPGWQVLGGFVARIPKMADLVQVRAANIALRVYGEYKATGSGTNNLRIREDKSGSPATLTPGTTRFGLLDTAGGFATFQFESTVAARAGRNRFTLEGNLNGGVTAASIRFTSMVLVDKGNPL